MDKSVWYYKIDGEKEGPISHEELQKKLFSGEINETTEVWTKSLESWMTISELEHFNMASLDETPTVTIEKKAAYSRETDMEIARPRPWIRFWARMIDYSLFFLVLGTIIGLFNLQLSISGVIAIFL